MSWHEGMPDRSGLASYTHLIRHPDDENELAVKGHHAGSGRDPVGWKKLNDRTPAEWAMEIAALLADGAARSFNRIVLELTDGWHHASAAFSTTMDDGLWHGVRAGWIQWRNGEPGVQFGATGRAPAPGREQADLFS